MALTANAVLTETKSLLNDPAGAIYSDPALLPLLAKSYRELQVKMSALGLSVTKEVIGTTQLMTGIKFLGDGSGLPTDLIHPIELGERLFASENKFSPMEEREWDPDTSPAETLRYWVWREETLWFVGATTDRQIMIRYIKSLSSVVDGTSPILINDSQTWLAQRTAALASLLLGHNPSRAEALITDLYSHHGAWEDFKAVRVKRMQNIPVRRRRTRWRIP